MASAVRRRGRPSGGSELRDRMLAAAREVFAEHGYAGAPTQLIAERAGVSKGLLFWHFRSKDELILEVARSVLPGDVVRECLAEGAEGEDLLRLIGRRYLEKYSDDVERRLFIHTMAIQDLYPEIAKEAMAPCTDLLEQASLRVYGRADVETVIALRAFLGGLMCYVMNPLDGVAQEHYVDSLIELAKCARARTSPS